MAWLEFTVKTEPGRAEDVAAVLTAQGFSELQIEDGAEFSAFLDENRAYWDYIDEELQRKLHGLSCVKLYLADDDATSRAHLETVVSELGLHMEENLLPEADWSESWKAGYAPIEVGKKIVIVPYWLSEYKTDRIPVFLNPGLSFGTGMHESTQMVMEAAEELLRAGMHCLDLGSGSGILSIAALRLGAASAMGVDIDPKAEDAARENAEYNRFYAPEFVACTGNVISDTALIESLAQTPRDLVFVNIVADVIIALAPVLSRMMTADGYVICSGVLCDRLSDVIEALERAGLTVIARRARGDWRCVTAKRREV